MLTLTLLDETFTICRLPASADVPSWAMPAGASFCAVARSRDELSIVCPSESVPDDISPRSDGWRCFRVEGPLDLRMNPNKGISGAQFLARVSEEKLAALLGEYADEPFAELIARAIASRSKQAPIQTTRALADLIRTALQELPRAVRER